MRRPRRLDRRRRAAAAQGPAAHRGRLHPAQEVRDPVHERPAAEEEDRPVQALALLHLVDPPGWRPGHARQVGVRGRRLRQGGRGHQAGQGQGLPRADQLHPVRRLGPRARGQLLRRDDRHRPGRHHRVARLFLRARARPGALPEPDQDQAAVPRHPQARQRRQGLGFHPVEPVHELPGRQRGL